MAGGGFDPLYLKTLPSIGVLMGMRSAGDGGGDGDGLGDVSSLFQSGHGAPARPNPMSGVRPIPGYDPSQPRQYDDLVYRPSEPAHVELLSAPGTRQRGYSPDGSAGSSASGTADYGSSPGASRVIASQPIGETGLHNVVYSNGEAGVHDDNNNPVHPAQVASVLGNGGVDSFSSHSGQGQLGAMNGKRLAMGDVAASGLHPYSQLSPIVQHDRNSGSDPSAPPNNRNSVTATWFIPKAQGMSNPHKIAPPGTRWVHHSDEGYVAALFPDGSTALRSPQGLWMSVEDWAERTGHTKPSSSPLPDYMVKPGDWRAGTGGPTVNRTDRKIHPPNKLAPSTPNRVSPIQLGEDWALGRTPAHSHPVKPGSPVPDVTFHSGDPMTEQLRKDQGIQSTLKTIAAGLNKGTITLGTDNRFHVGLEGAGESRVGQDAKNILTNGRTGNLTATFLGTYDGRYKIVRIDPKKRIALVRMHATNMTDRESASRIPKWGYGKPRNTVQDSFEHPFEPVRHQLPTGILNNSTKGMGKNMRQDFEWYERVPY